MGRTKSLATTPKPLSLTGTREWSWQRYVSSTPFLVRATNWSLFTKYLISLVHRISNRSAVIIIVARLLYRWAWLNRFRSDDGWIAVAGVCSASLRIECSWLTSSKLFLLGYTASQIGTNIYGGGLHMDNVRNEWLEWHWHVSWQENWLV